MKRILVIEDEPQTRENLVTILEMEGYQPLTASDGRAGLEAAKRELPDLVLCDVMMPEMDGYAVLEALRAHPETISTPFIFLTAKGDRKDLRAGMTLGADDYLSKPVTTAELLDAIGTRLQRHRENTEAAQQKVEFKPNFDSTAPLEAGCNRRRCCHRGGHWTRGVGIYEYPESHGRRRSHGARRAASGSGGITGACGPQRRSGSRSRCERPIRQAAGRNGFDCEVGIRKRALVPPAREPEASKGLAGGRSARETRRAQIEGPHQARARPLR